MNLMRITENTFLKGIRSWMQKLIAQLGLKKIK